MSDANPQDADDLIAVAKIVKTRGLRGELVADLLTDFPQRFEGLEGLIAISPGGERLTLKLEDHWFHDGRLVVKFAGYSSIDEAQKLVGHELTVPEAERVQLEEDAFYDWELEGCSVETLEGTQLGAVTEVIRTGGVEILVVKNNAGHEYLIPLAEDICVEIDIASKRIRIDPPEGLLEM
jgi:16S rRNA processing protein RimM